jgi:hypothetical protein
MAKTYQLNGFTQFGNTMSGLVIKLGIGPGGMHLLRTRGRKSGLPRTTRQFRPCVFYLFFTLSCY